MKISRSNAQAKPGAGGGAVVNSPKSPKSGNGKSALAVRQIKTTPKSMPGC